MNEQMTADLAEFDCGCYIRLTPERAVSLWQCVAGDNCPGWKLIAYELNRCMSQLRIHARGRSL